MKKIYMLRDTASSVPLEFTVLRVPLFLEPQKPVAQVKMSVFGRARTRVTSTEVSGAEDALPIIGTHLFSPIYFPFSCSNIVLLLTKLDEMAQQGWKMNCFDIPVENKQTHREISILLFFELPRSFFCILYLRNRLR